MPIDRRQIARAHRQLIAIDRGQSISADRLAPNSANLAPIRSAQINWRQSEERSAPIDRRSPPTRTLMNDRLLVTIDRRDRSSPAVDRSATTINRRIGVDDRSSPAIDRSAPMNDRLSPTIDHHDRWRRSQLSSSEDHRDDRSSDRQN